VRRTCFIACLTLFLLVSSILFGQKLTPEQAQEAVKKAALFFQSLAINGGYVGIYTVDLGERYGENFYEPAKPGDIWVQPPGTPSVGECYLRAYKATGETMYLGCARAVGLALA